MVSSTSYGLLVYQYIFSLAYPLLILEFITHLWVVNVLFVSYKGFYLWLFMWGKFSLIYLALLFLLLAASWMLGSKWLRNAWRNHRRLSSQEWLLDMNSPRAKLYGCSSRYFTLCKSSPTVSCDLKHSIPDVTLDAKKSCKHGHKELLHASAHPDPITSSALVPPPLKHQNQETSNNVDLLTEGQMVFLSFFLFFLTY